MSDTDSSQKRSQTPDHIIHGLNTQWGMDCQRSLRLVYPAENLYLEEVYIDVPGNRIRITRTESGKRLAHWKVSGSSVIRAFTRVVSFGKLRWLFGAGNTVAMRGGPLVESEGSGVPGLFLAIPTRIGRKYAPKRIMECDPQSWPKVRSWLEERKMIWSAELGYFPAEQRSVRLIVYLGKGSDLLALGRADHGGEFV